MDQIYTAITARQNLLLRSAFLCTLLVLLTLALVPVQDIPQGLLFWDKAQHVLAFTLLAILGLLAFPQNPRLLLCFVFGYGGLIELLQSTLTSTRHGDFLDWCADGLGVLLGWGILRVLVRFTKVLGGKRRRAKNPV